MARVERTLLVHRPIEEVFAYTADFGHIAEWDPNVVRSEPEIDEPPRVGSRYRVVVRMGPGRMPLQYEVEQIEPPRHVRLRGEGGGLEVTDEIAFESVVSGTQIRWSATMRARWLPSMAEGLVAGAFERVADQTMAGLAAALDGHGRSGKNPGLLTTVADRLVLPGMIGFTRLGYAARRARLEPLDLDLRDRVAVVTGATSGLGLATVHALAELGARVILVGRDGAKLERVAADVTRAVGRPDLALECADLALVREVRALAGRLRATEPRIHVLINNAGVLLPQREITAEGVERTLATNLLGHFVLTEELLPLLRRSAPARIVNVSSGGMYTQRIRTDDLQSERGRYDGTAAYARTKRGQVILTELWAERLRGSGVVVNAMHPGWADTPGVRWSLPGFHRVMRSLLRTPEQGADTIVWLAAAPEAGRETGKFWLDREPHPTHLLPGTRESESDRRTLWLELERLSAEALAVGR